MFRGLGLSILYLRCRRKQDLQLLRHAGAFNSLFEMRTSRPCCFSTRCSASFNSLFEMPTAAAAAGAIAAGTALSILYLRCPEAAVQ